MRIFKCKYSLLIPFLLFLISCNQSIKVQDLMSYVDNPDNGLVKIKKHQGIQFEVKYLPPEYLAYKEIVSDDELSMQNWDSIYNEYSDAFTLLLSFKYFEEFAQNGDVMYYGIDNYSDYSKRTKIMHFQMAELLSMIIDNTEYRPVLTSLENLHGLLNERSIYFVFPRNEEIKESTKIDIKYNDEIFSTGISHFLFKAEDLENIPTIIIENN